MQYETPPAGTPARAEIPGQYGPFRCLATPAGPLFEVDAVRAICDADAHRLRRVSMVADYHRLVLRPDGVVEEQHIYPEQPPGRRARTRCDWIEHVPDAYGRYLLPGHPGPWEITDHAPDEPLPLSRAEQADAALRPVDRLDRRIAKLYDELRPLRTRALEIEMQIGELRRKQRPHLRRAGELDPHRYGHYARPSLYDLD